MVYLICFDRHFGHARHYIGYSKDECFEQRIECHKKGCGSRLLRAVTQAGIDWQVVRTWPGEDGNFERYLKRQKHAERYCPVCQERLRKEKLKARIEEQLKKAG